MPKSPTPMSPKVASAFIQRAHDLFHDEGRIEIDDVNNADPLAGISASETIDEVVLEGGMYVKAWVWVSVDDLTVQKKRELGLSDATDTDL